MIQPQSLYSEQHEAVLHVNELRHIARYLVENDVDSRLGLGAYRENLVAICEKLSDLTLIDLILILIEGLDSLVDGNIPITKGHCVFLLRLPDLIEDCLSFGDSKMPSTMLIRHMSLATWVRPLTMDEEKYFIGQMVQGIDIGSSIMGQDDKNTTLDELDLSLVSVAGDMHGAYEDGSDECVVDQAIAGLVADVDDATPVTAKDSDDYDIPPSDASTIHEEFIYLDQSADEQYIKNFQADSNSSNEMGKSINVNSEQQALIDLICVELEELIDVYGHWSQDISLDTVILSQEMVEPAEHMGNAIGLLGLDGLAGFCKQVATIADRYTCESKLEFQSLLEWPQLCLNYLRNIYDQNAAYPLLNYLTSCCELSVDMAEYHHISDKLSHPVLIQEDKAPRQTIAAVEDMDLSLPDDVNQELLDGLLQDLPAQTSEFSAAIVRLAENGDVTALDTAQRIAHTLKGAANVVGVKGVANLTHHLEDILEFLAHEGKLPVKSLMDVLVNASDCLETMAEALLGIDNPPQDAQQVFQQVLDWANRLEQGNVLTEEDNSKLAAVVIQEALPAEDVATTAQPKVSGEANVENLLRIPASLADELLRLSGENLITTGQIQDRIKNTLKHYNNLKNHNQSLQQLSFDLEHLVDIQGITSNINARTNSDENDFDPLEMDDYHELHAVSRRLIELSADAFELSKVMEQEVAELSNLVVAQDNIQKESQQLVMRTRMVPVKTIVPRLKRGIRQAARVTGKQVELTVLDNDTYLDSEVLNEMIEPLMHILRNAVDHGIESTEQRKEHNKPEQGQVEIRFNRMGDLVVISIQDDGCGLDEAKIKAKAVQRGLIRPDHNLSRDEVLRLILEQGFSTRDVVTQVSGRGIGLDVVNIKLRDLKGMINIYSDVGLGTRLELILPVTSFSTHSLLVRVRKNIYAISSRGIEEILYPGLGKLADMGKNLIFQLDDQAYGAVVLDQLFNLPMDARNLDRHERPVIIVKDESGGRKAVLVQELIDSRDVVVKPLGRYLPKMQGVVGATILGNGSVAPVIDLPELLQKSKSFSSPVAGHTQSLAQHNHKRLPCVLVVDDSLSARRSLSQFVQDLGMDVRSARDGMEAVKLIEAKKPDLVLVDMEMPRMNGLELTGHIRGTQATADIPVIMITSRSSTKHKAAAHQRGVNHFMVKPYAEDELAKYIQEALENGKCSMTA